jgi:hypothetical protein
MMILSTGTTTPGTRIGWIRVFATKNNFRTSRNCHSISQNFADEYREISDKTKKGKEIQGGMRK